VKILICGSRLWTHRVPIERELRRLTPYIVIHGHHWQGADPIADAVGRELGAHVRRYPADWKKYGRAAGPKRNQEMIDKEHLLTEPIEVCLAFAENFAAAHGTSDMRRRAAAAGIRVESFES
jgi:hypothetical protein